jgi:hypothetical protein
MPKGGARPGAGRPRKTAQNAELEGRNNVKVLSFPVAEGQDADMPVPDYIQGNLVALTTLKQAHNWLLVRKCLNLINEQLLFDYAWNRAMHVQCEKDLRSDGMWSNHPTTGAKMLSPLVAASQNYLKAAQSIWGQIQKIIADNCASAYDAKTANDPLEILLSGTVGVRNVKD